MIIKAKKTGYNSKTAVDSMKNLAIVYREQSLYKPCKVLLTTALETFINTWEPH